MVCLALAAWSLVTATVRSAHAEGRASADVPPELPDRDPPPGLPRDPYAGLAPLEDDPFDNGPTHESTTWILASVGVGGGSSRLGPIATEGALEGHFFVLPHLSIGGRLGALGFGEPDGNGASARFATGLVGYRVRLAGDQRASEGASATWLHVATGAGWIGIKGYEKEGGARHDFDVDRWLLATRAAVIWARGVFAISLGLDVLGVPREGFAALPTLTIGFLF